METATVLGSPHGLACLRDARRFYINGEWVTPSGSQTFPVINPATEEAVGTISLGNESDVDRAVAAAETAYGSYSQTPVNDRIALLKRIVDCYQARMDEVAETVSMEMGAPISLSRKAQAPSGMWHFVEAIRVLQYFKFEDLRGSTLVRKEPIGVCALITPWNWPVNQIACKVAPALAAGCTMVLKPSEIAPLSALLFAQILEDAELPAGVFNLINGTGPAVGAMLAAHPRIAMVSFTGSTRGGIAVARAAAAGVKRVTQELGGKSANLILDDADLSNAVTQGVQACCRNSGQSCNAPTRMLVPKTRLEEANAIARTAAEVFKVGNPNKETTDIGPLVSKTQFDKVQQLIKTGMEEGATLIAGGPGLPSGLRTGYFVRPTVFTNVRNDMTIAREEIFGPVLCIIPYENEEEAVMIANDTPYGLSGYVTSANEERARRVAKRIRCGNVHLNYANLDFAACFGGYKQSGNGREWGEAGLNEFLELKAILGYQR